MTDTSTHLSQSPVKRASWDQTWITVAKAMSKRSACTRRQVGAVIVSSINRIVATSYNGPPANFPGGYCADACPRGRGEVEPTPDYDGCIALHAEENALMFNDRSDSIGGTIYVSSMVCNRCALMIANSGIARVVMTYDEVRDAHRDPEKTIAILLECGLEVITNRKRYGGYRRDFYEAHGPGPHDCYFCHERLPYVEVVHHVDENRSNNSPENLVPVHTVCHNAHHSKSQAGVPRGKYARKKRESKVSCPTCGLESYPGPLGRHRKMKGH